MNLKSGTTQHTRTSQLPEGHSRVSANRQNGQKRASAVRAAELAAVVVLH